jgi:hypothetical protein
MSPDGRYATLPIRERTLADGTVVVYRARRFLPPPRTLPARREQPLERGTRLDLFAAQVVGDSLSWWRLCDANAVLSPADLERDAGRPVRIPDPSPHATS